MRNMPTGYLDLVSDSAQPPNVLVGAVMVVVVCSGCGCGGTDNEIVWLLTVFVAICR